MRWTPLFALSLLVLALPAHAARQAGSSTTTIRLISTTTRTRMLVDRPPTLVVNNGDVLLAKSILRNEVAQFGRQQSATVGSDVWTYTQVTRYTGDVKATATLPGGTIHAAGRIGDTPAQTIRVTGGTGSYADARGTSTVTDRRGPRAIIVYRLQLP
jgi:hypothetical protein